ncbi:hypothetical protein [Curtobacterium sp. UNCCL20]|uniref:hypothetical protein n=1 Tax=Curtobacterium sp. UNCCL20 TaxID=1502773 RepID=UPI000B80FAD1|nr:hypothetical protein [Curtobacterium sp. UNCCL20]
MGVNEPIVSVVPDVDPQVGLEKFDWVDHFAAYEVAPLAFVHWTVTDRVFHVCPVILTPVT